jgi:hypothetical protein
MEKNWHLSSYLALFQYLGSTHFGKQKAITLRPYKSWLSQRRHHCCFPDRLFTTQYPYRPHITEAHSPTYFPSCLTVCCLTEHKLLRLNTERPNSHRNPTIRSSELHLVFTLCREQIIAADQVLTKFTWLHSR